MKKICILIMVIMLLAVGCKKEEEKEYIIGEDVGMFMSVTEDSSFDDVVSMMKKAESDGLGEFKGANYGLNVGYGDTLSFHFDIKNTEAKENHERGEYLNQITGQNYKNYLNGHPVFKTNYRGASIYVDYVKTGYGLDDIEIKSISYWAEDDNEKMGDLGYDFRNGRMKVLSISTPTSGKANKMLEKADKSEVDAFLVELTN